MRRVGIYAYGPTTVAVNQPVSLRTWGKESVSQLVDKIELSKGIYRIDGDERLVVSIGGACDVSILEDKDPWPDPKVAPKRFDTAFGISALDSKKFADFFSNIDRGLAPSK